VPRINNLVGQLDFSDTDLESTQRGLDNAGIRMPNFSGLQQGEEEPEPEPEPESETERLERYLRESQFLLTSFITFARGYVARQRHRRVLGLNRHAVAVQTAARAALARRRHALLAHKHREDDFHRSLPHFQAAARRRLAVDRRDVIRRELRRLDRSDTFSRIQAACRTKLVRHHFQSARKRIEHSGGAITSFQAAARGKLLRDRFNAPLQAVAVHEAAVTRLQGRIRGALVRIKQASTHEALGESEVDIRKFQACARGYNQRRHTAEVLASLAIAAPSISALQAMLRGQVVRQRNAAIRAHLAQNHVAQWAASLQKLTRAAVVRRQHETHRKDLNFVQPDVIGIQTAARGAIVRRRWVPWRDYLRMPEVDAAATVLQAIVLGTLARRSFYDRIGHYYRNEWTITKCQAVVRQRQQRRLYRQLMHGHNVSIDAIKNFLDLLRDSQFDFKEELEIEDLQHQLVERIRRNQQRESQAALLEYKVELLVKGKITLDEVEKARRAGGLMTGQAKQQANNVLMAARDPFALGSLDGATRRKLELYQETFYLLQTQPEYLARVLHRLSRADPADTSRTNVERIVLTTFGYAQQSREEYLLLKLLQARRAASL
jgi:Ras GTPase-activating-like protein IQGAP2/3